MLQSIFTGLSSLINHQRAMDVTSNNVANAETPGYSKQRANLSSLFAKDVGNHQIGVGVHTKSVTRMHDEMLFSQLKNAHEDNASANQQYVHMMKVQDSLVGDGLDGPTITNLTDEFFDSVQNLADNPYDNAVKADVRVRGEDLIDRAGRLNNYLNDYKQSLNDEKDLLMNEANSYLSQLDGLSKKIAEIEAGNELPTYELEYANELRDKRDLLEVKLSKIGDFNVWKDNKSTTGDINISDSDHRQYQFEFKSTGGRLEGIDKSLDSINGLQTAFNNTFGPLGDKVTEFIDDDMHNPNDFLQWRYDNTPSKDINAAFVGFGSKVEAVGNVATSTEAIMKSYQDKNDKLTKVNLDEEMTNMIRYQRAYEAAAKVIQTSDEMLKTLLDMKR
jgi:flagellar hook-associated protein 1 FlgK